MNVLKDRRISISLVLFLIAVVINASGSILIGKVRTQVSSTSYPSVSCPSPQTGSAGKVYLSNSAIGIRSITKNSTRVKSAKSIALAVTDPLFIDGGPTLATLMSAGSGALAATPCTTGLPDEWFVGGSGALGSQAVVQMINSGLSESIVDLIPYASKGPLPILSVHIPANSEKDLLVDAMAPGESAVAIHAITRAGRTTTYLLDHRQKGLRSLGSDYISPIVTPTKHLIIAGGVNSASTLQTLRLFTPGSIDGNVSVSVIAADGTFIPVGLDNVTARHGSVIDIPLKNFQSSTYFSLSVQSDQPVLASLFTSTASDLGWSSGAQALDESRPMTLNLGATKAALIFTGSPVRVHISWRSAAGESKKIFLSDDNFAMWSPAEPLTLLQISTDNPGTFAAAVLSGKPGFSYLPLTPGGQMESSSLPIPDARTISRG